MIRPQTRLVLALLHENIMRGLDSLDSARAFLAGLDFLSPTERLFLEAALSSRGQLAEFHRVFVARRSEVPLGCATEPSMAAVRRLSIVAHN